MALINILKSYRAGFEAEYAQSITRQQTKAINAVLDCRSARYGATALDCSQCDYHTLNYHACGNRACHQCQNYDTTQWIEKQQRKLLPVEYFLVTFTLPSELRSLARHHQKACYNLLMQCARSTLLTFASNHPKLAGELGMTMVLHTHTRRLDYHPHVHIVVPAVALNKRRKQCTKLPGKYLFNHFNLAKVFRGRFIDAIKKAELPVPAELPKKWVADCRHVGRGLSAIKYLSRYLYRGVISEKNIIKDDGQQVTFRYLDSKIKGWKTRTVTGEHFLWLIYQHVLPKGFRRVRDYGFLHGNAKKTLQRIQIALRIFFNPVLATASSLKKRPAMPCKLCGAPLNISGFILPGWRSG